MRNTAWLLVLAITGLLSMWSCESGSRGSNSDGDSDGDGDTGMDSDPTGDPGDVSGVVLAPNGSLPISGALVYVSSYPSPQIEDTVYCYECEDMSNYNWTLSGADGSFFLEDVPSGDWNIVTRKGFFQRERQVTVAAGTVNEIPAEYTTLPAENNGDGTDQIPNYAVLLTSPDQSHFLLAKFGMYTGTVGGSFPWGQETFDIFNNSVNQSGYPDTASLFASQASMEHYHMLFLPCNSSSTGLSFVSSNITKLQDYVSHGGKIYNSCTVAAWTEIPFPEYIEYYGSDDPAKWDIGRYSGSALTTQGTIVDPDLRAWLDVVSGQNLDAYPFENGYSLVESLNSVSGHGLEEDGYISTPYTWVAGSGSDAYAGLPLMMTYIYDCGKVFYSIYETTGTGTALTPQEYVLLYITLEVGVCDGDYVIE